KLILNLTPEVRFQNACTKNIVFRSWEEKAKTDADAADKVKRYRHRPGVELYDLSSDPLEWKNVAEDPKFADIKNDLQTRLLAWMKSQGDQGQQTELDALQHQNRNRNKNNKKNNNKSKNNQGTN
ncbi:MAG: sulfatase atsG, partial [Pirellulaceae bacterium]|nr:sulfatase atsG [Pirellulaceae bacterium]